MDDTLDVFPCHGVGGIVGMIMTGIFATNNCKQRRCRWIILWQCCILIYPIKGLAIVVTYSFIVSYLIFKVVNLVQPIRVSSEDEEMGLDESQHSEKYLQGTLLVSENGSFAKEERAATLIIKLLRTSLIT